MYKSLTAIFEETPEPGFQIQGFKTGFRSLDYALEGIKASDLVLLVAKAANHGSIFLENIAAGLSRQYHVLLINTEKSALAVAAELKAILMPKAETDQDESPDELNQMAGNLFVEDKVRFIADLDKTIEKFRTEYPDGSIVLIDNLNGLFLSKVVRTYPRQQEEYEISQNLKMLTLKHTVPIILYSRIKFIDNVIKSGPPSTADIMHLADMDCHFDKILGIHRTDYNVIDVDSDEGATAYGLLVHVLRNGSRKQDVVKLNISDSNRFLVFGKER